MLAQLIAMMLAVALALGIGLGTDDHSGFSSLAITLFVLGVAEGFGADALLHWRARSVGRHARARGLEGEALAGAFRRAGSVSPVSVLVVVLPVLLVAWKLYDTMDVRPAVKPAISAMKADLRNLVSAEESYFADYTVYTSSLPNLQNAPNPYFRGSEPVSIILGPATATGWSATAAHPASTRTCAVFVGTATPPLAGMNEGEPRC